MKIIWSPTARNKTKEILEHISKDNPDAALALIDLIEEKVDELTQNRGQAEFYLKQIMTKFGK